MDTSKDYIKMCERADEIQKLWGYEERDIYYFKGYDNPSGFIKRDEIRMVVQDNPLLKHWWTVIWIPTQDQLQEMILKTWFIDETNMAYLFGKWCSDNGYQGSMEQLWLVYVMRKRFNKIWNGKEWIKENSNDRS